MKRIFSAVWWFAVTAGAFSASGYAQSAGYLSLSKNFSGAITRSSVEVALSPNADCDQTQALIPEGSKLVSQSFTMNADANGVGTFQGLAIVVTPDNRVILQGSLRGTVGVNPRCNAAQGCRLPWHLEGLFETQPGSFERLITRSTSAVSVPLMMLNFSADQILESASPVPTYRGRLDGLIPTLPASVAKVTLVTDKPSYTVNDPITAIIINGAEMTIQAYDLKSFCSIIQLQVQNGNQWDDVATCPLKRLSFPVTIAASQRMDVPLLSNAAITTPGPGIYRLALTFRFLQNNTPISDSFLAFSQSFTIAPQPPSNSVIVKAERSLYQDREPIVIKITNDQEQAIVAEDHKSYCTVLNIQRQEGDNWVNVAPCLLLSPIRLIKIGSREDLFVKIANEDAASRLTPGTYRLELTYSGVDNAGQPAGSPVTVYGATFTVASKE